jgi:hypothetical protein
MRGSGRLLLAVVVCVACGVFAAATQADGPTVVSFTEIGRHTFTVPPDVKSIHVVAVGAPGGSAGAAAGGMGAVAVADVAVTPGETLSVYVGGTGQSDGLGEGGFNGGGDGGGNGNNTFIGQGGGGASDVRVGNPGTLQSRLVTAGGGGGAALNSTGVGSAGGAAGASGQSQAGVCAGGGGGTPTAGGGGGFKDGQAGTLGAGGFGPDAGGGGGGLFGGGGGGAVYNEGSFDFIRCGGGGGSSGFGPGTSGTSVAVAQTSQASVTISFVPSPPSSSPGSSGSSGGASGGSSPGSPSPSPAGPDTVAVNLSLPKTEHGMAVVGTVAIAANRSSLKAKLLPAKGTQASVGSLAEAQLKKGLHSFTVELNRKGRKSLARLGKLKLTLEVKVIPPQGAIGVASRRLTLKP